MRVPDWFRLPGLLREISNELNSIDKRLKTMAIQITELATALTDIKALIVEGTTELTSKIAALEEALAAGGEIPPEAQSALEDLKGVAQVLADIVPNAPPVE